MNLYRIWFKDGFVITKYANGPLEAAILAQADKIFDKEQYSINSIMNEETGQIYYIKPAEVIKVELTTPS